MAPVVNTPSFSLTPIDPQDAGRIPDLRNAIGAVPFYITINALGQIGLLILVATFVFGKRVYRSPTLVNFCCTWIIYSVIYSLFLYGDRDYTRIVQSPICTAQAYLVHGAAPMCASAALLLIVNIWMTLQDIRWQFWERINPTARMITGVLFPYFTLLGFAIGAQQVDAHKPGFISSRNGLYCTIYIEPFRGLVTPLATTILMVVTLGFEILLIVQSVRHFSRTSKTFPMKDHNASMSLIIRIGVFTVYSILAAASAATFLTRGVSHAWQYMIPATVPFAAFLVFGSQKELIFAWFPSLHPLERKTHGSSSSISSIKSLVDHSEP